MARVIDKPTAPRQGAKRGSSLAIAAKAEALWQAALARTDQKISLLWRNKEFRAKLWPYFSDSDLAVLFFLPELTIFLLRAGTPEAEIARVINDLHSSQKTIGGWFLADQETRRIIETRGELDAKRRSVGIPEEEISRRLAPYQEEMARVRKDHRTWLVNLVAGPSHRRQQRLLSIEERIRKQCRDKKQTPKDPEPIISELTLVCIKASSKVHDLRCAGRAWKPAYEKILAYQRRFNSRVSQVLACWDGTPPSDIKDRLREPEEYLKHVRENKAINSTQVVRTIILNAGIELSEILKKCCPNQKVADELAAELLDPWLRGVLGTTADSIKTARLSDISPPRRLQRK